MTHTPTQDQSCFTDPESFDCLCHTAMQRQCRKEEMRKQMVHPNGRIYTLTQCVHFFVCTHSNTCKSYKDAHCKHCTKRRAGRLKHAEHRLVRQDSQIWIWQHS